MSIEEKKEIINTLREILIRRKEIEFAIIFGTFISELPFKDIDIGVYLNKSLIKKINKIDYIINLGSIIEEKLKVYKIDLVILNDLEFTFLYHVFKEGKLIFARNKEKYYEFVIYVIENFLDFKVFRDYILKQ